MSETKYHPITDHSVAAVESCETASAIPSTQPPTPSDTGARPHPTTSDAGASAPPTTSDIIPAPAQASGVDDNNQPDEAQGGPVPTEAEGDKGVSHGVRLCLHVMGDGVFCQIPALGGRPYCYRHLRLRGQMMRMARAIAQRQPYQVVLPPLDDMHAVQAALAHVAAAMSAGLLERRRAGLLLYTLQQASSNLRFLARAQAQAQAQAQSKVAPGAGLQATPTAGAPPLSPSVGDRVGSGGPQRVVQEYPEFEAEFGLPPGLDLTTLPQVAFPPPEKAEKADPWAGLTTPQTSSVNRWTKEDIEMEELDKRQPHMSEESYCKQSRKLHAKVEKQVATELRKEREAEWEAEAARRNAEEEKKAQRWRSMDAAQQRAYWEGVRDAHETAERDRRQEAARVKKPVAKVGGEEAGGMGKLPENEAAK